MSQVANAATVVQGQLLDYTITVQNVGTSNATLSTFTDTLPAGVTAISASSNVGTVTETAGVVNGNLGTMAPGETATIDVKIMPNTGTTGPITNTASVASPDDTNPANNTSTLSTTVNAAPATAPDLSVARAVSATTAVPGQLVTYTLTVTNNSAANSATNVQLTDLLPASANLVTATASQGTVSESNGVGTANLGALAAGATATVTVEAMPTAAGTLTDNAVVTTDSGDTATANNSASGSVTVNAASATAADVAVTTAASPAVGTVGSNETYTLTISNNSATNAAANVTLTDVLPTGVTFVSGAASGSATVTESGGIATVSYASLATGATQTVTLVVTPTAPGVMTNTATVTTTSGDTNPANNVSTTLTPVTGSSTPAVDLSITKTVAPSSATVGTNETYTITVKNNSTTTAASGVVMTDVLPTNATFVSATDTTTSTSLTPTAGMLTDNIGNLAAGGTETITVVVTPTAAGAITNTASVVGAQLDTNLSNNVASVTTPVVGTTGTSVDLSVTKTAAPAIGTVGSNETYTITVTNNSTSTAATGVVMTDVLPANATFVSATDTTSGTSLTPVGDVLTDSIGNLAAGATETITVVVTPTVAGAITNTAMVEGNQPDTNQANNIATVTTPVQGNTGTAVDLSITKTVSPSTGTVGTNETYTITVANNSTSAAATGVVMTDVLPAGATFLSGTDTTTGATLTPSSGVLTDNIGPLAAGATDSITVVLTPTTAGSLTNTAMVEGAQPDTNQSNNTATVTTQITEANVSITKVASPNPDTVGQNLTYTITVSNTGGNAAAGTVVTDTLPSGVTFVSAIDTTGGTITQSSGTVTDNVGTLAAGASDVITVIVTPTAAGSLTNSASVTTTSPNSSSNTTASVATTVLTEANVSITKTASPNPDTVGQNLTYTITVSNTGGSAAAGTVVTDTLPAGVTFVSAVDTTGGTIAQSGGTVTDTVGSLAAGATDTITVTVTPTQAGTLTNTASVTTTSPNSSTNTTASATTTVNAAEGQADVSITKVASPDPDTVGQNLTYTITVTNTGTASAANTVMTDTLPAGVTFVSGSDTLGGSVTQSGGTVTDNLGTLAAGATDVITVIVTPTQAGTLTNTASVTTTSANSSTNTTASVTSTVTSVSPPPPSGQCYLPGKAGDGTDATFVTNLYFELLGRAPDTDGYNYWLSFLAGKGHANSFNNPRENELIQVFLSTAEYRQHLVTCMYEHFLNRAPDQGGLQYFVQQLSNGKDEEFVLTEIVGSQEYYNNAGGTAQGFATALYNDLLGRAPDAGGLTYWEGVANNHSDDRASVVHSMLGTPEALHDLLNNPSSTSALSNLTGGGWIQLYFQGDQKSAQTAYDKLVGHTPWDDVIEDMIETPEYYNASQPGL